MEGKVMCFLVFLLPGIVEIYCMQRLLQKAKGMKVIGLTGEKDSKLSEISDTCIQVPETETYKIQELHLPVYHCLCLMLEDTFFGKE